MEDHGKQEPAPVAPVGTAALARTKDPSYHVFKLEGGAYVHLTPDGPVKTANVESAVKRVAGPVGDEPEEFFAVLGDHLKPVRRRPTTAEVFD